MHRIKLASSVMGAATLLITQMALAQAEDKFVAPAAETKAPMLAIFLAVMLFVGITVVAFKNAKRKPL